MARRVSIEMDNLLKVKPGGGITVDNNARRVHASPDRPQKST
jgi:hypothetical protein